MAFDPMTAQAPALPFTSPSDGIRKRTAQIAYSYALPSVPEHIRTIIERYVDVLERSVLDEWKRWCAIHERELLPAEDAVQSRFVADGLGYLDLANIRPGVPAVLRRELRRLVAEGAKALILDLRDNGGSSPEDAVRVVSEFVDSGPVVRLSGEDARTLDAIPGGVALSLPVAVLINNFSASGAEVVAAAFQYHSRGTVVGEQSFAKDWTWRKLSDGSELKTGSWTTPDGKSVANHGVRPDLHVVDRRAGGLDPILERAIEALTPRD